MAKKKPIVIIERIPPTDEHDRQKFYRLRGYVEGSPPSTWKTTTVLMVAIAQKGQAVIDKAKAKLEKDVIEYAANVEAANKLEKQT
jgi:hypothetical protein